MCALQTGPAGRTPESMTSPTCPCGRPALRPGDPCPGCQIRVIKALARGCFDLATAPQKRMFEAQRAAIETLRLR